MVDRLGRLFRYICLFIRECGFLSRLAIGHFLRTEMAMQVFLASRPVDVYVSAGV